MTHCVIIDDEEPARELIVNYLETLPGFELVASLDNAIDGFNFLQKNKVSLLFLDIQMPRITGLELVNALKEKPQIVLTFAYRDYAVEGFDLEVFDYLVKPIARDRFLKTIGKYLHFERITEASKSSGSKYKEAYIFLKVGKEQKKVYLNEILFIEGLKDYMKVFTESKMMVVYDRLGYMELKLPDFRFVRVHKSFIVAVDKVAGFTHSVIKVGTHEIPVGRMYKKGFTETMAHFTG